MKPTKGRIINFVADRATLDTLGCNHLNDPEGAIVPAMIVQVWSDTYLNIKVFGDSNLDLWVTSVTYDDSPTPKPHTWHWPPRV